MGDTSFEEDTSFERKLNSVTNQLIYVTIDDFGVMAAIMDFYLRWGKLNFDPMKTSVNRAKYRQNMIRNTTCSRS